MRKYKNYLVGYDQDHQTIYGKHPHTKKIKDVSYTDAMTLHDAKIKLAQLGSPEKGVIYKLVPVVLN